MIARLLISRDLESIKKEVEKTLRSHLENWINHPDVLYFKADSKLGIGEARIIKEHFSLKPYSAKGRVVVMENAGSLTVEAQNALLKILEEPPKEALILLGTKSQADLLPTVISRCQIIHLPDVSTYPTPGVGYVHTVEDIEKLLNSTIEERFEYIEKLKDKKEFLKDLVHYFHQTLRFHPKDAGSNFLKELLQAEAWTAQNVNIRAILEYLMLVMPTKN